MTEMTPPELSTAVSDELVASPNAGAPTLRVDVIADGFASDGAYAILDVRARAGTVLPAHLPAREDGTLLVLAGCVAITCGADRVELGPGEVHVLPRSVPRRISVLENARVLCLAAPAGVERLTDLLSVPPLAADDVAALLAGAGVQLLPSAWGT